MRIALQGKHASGGFDGRLLLCCFSTCNHCYAALHRQCATSEHHCGIIVTFSATLPHCAVLQRDAAAIHGQWNAVVLCHPIARISTFSFNRAAITQTYACVSTICNGNILAENLQQCDLCTICRRDRSTQIRVILIAALRHDQLLTGFTLSLSIRCRMLMRQAAAWAFAIYIKPSAVRTFDNPDIIDILFLIFSVRAHRTWINVFRIFAAVIFLHEDIACRQQ